MTKLPLNCPHCHTPLVYIPRDGLTLQYRCAKHGDFILRPLVVVEADDVFAPVPAQTHQFRSTDAA